MGILILIAITRAKANEFEEKPETIKGVIV
jgi:hypothetical protein